MKIIILSLLVMATVQSYAATTYTCDDVQRINGWGHSRSATLTLATTSGLLAKKRLKSVTLIETVPVSKNQTFTEIENPFTNRIATDFVIEPNAVIEASAQKFSEVSTSGFKDVRIALSESILKGGAAGYARFYKKSTNIIDTFTSHYYFKCVKQ
jgi:hypothetical protein